MVDTPTVEPAELVAGDTLSFKRSLADYPATAGWSLRYALQSAAGRIVFDSTASGADHLVSVAASTTAQWVPGVYAWACYAIKAAERYQIAGGTITVRADFVASGPHDARSHARRVLESIEAVLERRATRDQEEYSIDGRSLKRTPIADLVKLRQLYRSEVRREEQAARVARGLDSGRRLHVRFSGPT